VDIQLHGVLVALPKIWLPRGFSIALVSQEQEAEIVRTDDSVNAIHNLHNWRNATTRRTTTGKLPRNYRGLYPENLGMSII
jgi:hypothetical protein